MKFFVLILFVSCATTTEIPKFKEMKDHHIFHTELNYQAAFRQMDKHFRKCSQFKLSMGGSQEVVADVNTKKKRGSLTMFLSVPLHGTQIMGHFEVAPNTNKKKPSSVITVWGNSIGHLDIPGILAQGENKKCHFLH